MKINFKIDHEEFFKLMYALTYRRGWIIFITVVGILMLLLSIFHFLGFYQMSTTPVFQLFFGFYVLIFIPLSVYFSAKRIFNSNKRLQENMTYEFFDQKMKITGESFNSELDLTKSYKIQEIRNWFLIYQSRQVANFIPKGNLSSDQINNMRFFFRQIRGIQVKLL